VTAEQENASAKQAIRRSTASLLCDCVASYRAPSHQNALRLYAVFLLPKPRGGGHGPVWQPKSSVPEHQHHTKQSCDDRSSTTSSTLPHRWTYWTTTGSVYGPTMSRIHAFSQRANATVRHPCCHIETIAHKSGAKSCTLLPSNQGSFQKRNEFPSRTTHVNEAWKRMLGLSSLNGKEAHGRVESVCNHNQRRRSTSRGG
jgi:hypothetical protein